MNREAEEGQEFLMPFLPAVVIRSSISCLQTGCIFGLFYFITVQQSKAPGRHDIRCSGADVVNDAERINML